ncbi:MAG: dihydropteroate synthase [Bacteriovoracaceae bacterium]|nr:dihydropteroate synthase [Bacteriovoracaceae bacterium]
MSFNFQNQKVNVWGVMNITPDSFSDGGELSSVESIEKRLESWKGLVDGVDIGAESTAPSNAAITALMERERLEKHFMPVLKNWPKELSISLDTYHIATASWFFSQVPNDIPIVWNDVSGKVDDDVISILKQHPRLKYVLCFNPVPTRLETSDHMNYVSSKAITQSARTFFKTQFDIFLRHELFSRVIADPCFGFAKSREQNQYLLNQIPLLIEELASPLWMLGISRKSFLRFPMELNPKSPEAQQSLDGLALLWYREVLDKLTSPHTINIRTHAPVLTQSLKAWQHLSDVWTQKS